MPTARREWLLRGVVQGVGFRPHVASVAAHHDVSGLCGNDDLQVFVEAQGEPSVLDAFAHELLSTLPPLARVIASTSRELPTLADEVGFRIVASRHLPGVRTLVPPDVATCDDCLADMADPRNRRHRYAFTTCTNCGPRLTIIEDLPYDRPATTMRVFGMCEACQREYVDPSDRRYHAQPISCYDCGPRLWLAGPEDAPTRPAGDWTPLAQAAVIEAATARLLAGEVLAVKGLGGFHLMADARHPEAVARLRERKRRSGKPFAVMVADTRAARWLAVLTPGQLETLASPARPIVIAPMASTYDLVDAVAPGLSDVGVMLPYTPLHSLLLESGLALVATSGNLSEEPLCHTNSDALVRLAGLADVFLLHDRDIHVPVEDSVVLAASDDGVLPVRRSRGYAPLPVMLPSGGDGPVVLAVGGELKNTFALATGDMAFVSAHIGDMGSLASQQAFDASVAQLVGIHRERPEVVVCDLHPGYATTAWAERYVAQHPDTRLLPVQHHLAHALALVAEHGLGADVVVVAALDGTGYGTDGTIWGGEILTLGRTAGSPWSWERAWHVPTFGLVGGDRAIRQPWRVAQGLAHSWGLDIGRTPAALEAPDAELRLVRSQLASGHGVVPTSSTGRLFDAAAAMLGLCLETTYEAQAAMLLERAAAQHGTVRQVAEPTSLTEVFHELLTRNGSLGERAARFHAGVAGVIADRLATEADAVGTTLVGVTGGVAVNRVFVSALRAFLRERGVELLEHRVVPPTDGGLSLGQAWAGRLAG